MNILDSHQHFWSLANSFTNWPTSDLRPIYRDFLPNDLGPLVKSSGVNDTILVQAAPDVRETSFLLNLASASSFVQGVVGWIDFAGPNPLDQLDEIDESPLLVGLRPMVQAIAEPGWLLRPEFDAIYNDLMCRGLTFDALIHRRQMPDIVALAKRHPLLPIVLDHAGKPAIAAGEFAPWARDIERLSGHRNVSCKLSGLWTEAGYDRSAEALAPYVSHLVNCFGAERLMWGSDWPVLEMAGRYPDWLAQCRSLLSDLAVEAQADIFGGNARRFYGLD